jgi:hypothetical protein
MLDLPNAQNHFKTFQIISISMARVALTQCAQVCASEGINGDERPSLDGQSVADAQQTVAGFIQGVRHEKEIGFAHEKKSLRRIVAIRQGPQVPHLAMLRESSRSCSVKMGADSLPKPHH